MTTWQRAGVAVVLLCVVASGWWLWRRVVGRVEPLSPSTAMPTSVPPAGPAAPPLPAPRGYRLAGVAVGDPESFAVIETASGANVLYRMNADIPGLGRLVRIEAERIVVQGEAGQMELWLMPAASPTPTRVRAATVRAAAAATRTALPQRGPPTSTPKPRPAGGASTP